MTPTPNPNCALPAELLSQDLFETGLQIYTVSEISKNGTVNYLMARRQFSFRSRLLELHSVIDQQQQTHHHHHMAEIAEVEPFVDAQLEKWTKTVAIDSRKASTMAPLPARLRVQAVK